MDISYEWTKLPFIFRFADGRPPVTHYRDTRYRGQRRRRQYGSYHRCVMCGKPFVAARAHALTCSSRCRKAKSRQTSPVTKA